MEAASLRLITSPRVPVPARRLTGGFLGYPKHARVAGQRVLKMIVDNRPWYSLCPWSELSTVPAPRQSFTSFSDQPWSFLQAMSRRGANGYVLADLHLITRTAFTSC